MRELLAAAKTELVIERSRFLCLAQPVQSPEEARAWLKTWKSEHPSASHVVHAFIVGKPGSQTTGYSDDGEPPGTAGRPLMDVLAGSSLGNLIWGVVRYFGGVKLGTGGLVQAYQECGKALMPLLESREWKQREALTLTLEYSAYETLKRHLAGTEHQISAETFGEKVELQLEVLSSEKKPLEVFLQNLTRGQY